MGSRSRSETQLKSWLLIILMVGLTVVLTPILGCKNSGLKKEVQIAADVNRDGKVEFRLDEQGKSRWTPERGAIFLNNNDSDQDTGAPDHADEVINGTEDLKDMAVLKVKKITDLPDDSQVTITVDKASMSRVRLFIKAGENESGENEYRNLPLSANQNINPAQLRQTDLELRIEANSYADSSWTGETIVTLTVSHSEGEIESDHVKLKVAPFILLPNLNEGKALYVREFPGRNDAFLESLRELVPAAGAELVVVPAGDPYSSRQIWLQDTMEIGYSEIPGQRINVVLKANRGRPLDDYAKHELMGPDFGWIQVGTFRKEYGGGGRENGWLDWYGNLEVTPPVPGFPFGRFYCGYNPDGPEDASLNPEIISMLEAQKIQGPALRLDTGWLFIKHVDEMISFLPSGDLERPFKVLVVDPGSMLALLEKWIKDGYGEIPILNLYAKKMTIKSLYENKDLIDLNRSLQKERIEPNIELLKAELNLKEEDFIRVPSLFDRYGSSLVPNMVNSTILSRYIFIVAPNGPVIDGKDQLEEEMRKLLYSLPLNPHFLDASLYHRWGGEVHCATNVRREGFRKPWWSKKYP